MASFQENKETVRAFFDALAHFDVDGMDQLLSPDATWWSAHSTGMSGTHDRDSFLGMVGNFKPQAAEPREFRFNDDWTVEDNRVAFTARAALRLKDGTLYEGDFGFLITVDDGKISSGKEYYDSRKVNELFFPGT
jgi:ketosteroid isomerase-like protein